MPNNNLPSVDSMLSLARAETGLHDIGEGDCLESLAAVMDAMNKDCVISANGLANFKAEVHRVFVNRLRFAEDLKRHPQILDEDVSDPIVILGMPRTGTTKLQRMISSDPDVQRLEYWRILNPAPFANAIKGHEDLRVEVGRQALRKMNELTPEYQETHSLAVHEVDEETFLQIHTFKSQLWAVTSPVPSYWKWLETQSLRSTFIYLRQLLQYLQWQDGGKRNRPWVLKSPAHNGAVDYMIEQFPNATLVCNHRNLIDVMPSYCLINDAAWHAYVDTTDLIALGKASLDIYGSEMQKHLCLRDELGEKLNILDLRFADVRDDPMSVVRKVYRHANRELTPRREQGIRDWLARDTHQGVRKYQYNLADYGLTPENISAAFGDYERRFAHLL